MLNEALNGVNGRREEIVELCRRLIQTPSPSGSEGEVAQILEEEMREKGFDEVYVDEMGNVVGVIKGSMGGLAVLFDGHMDTVPPGDLKNWSVDPYGAVIAEGCIHGRGASDMKGALASMLHAGALIKEFGIPIKKDVAFAFVVHEETYEGYGVANVIRRLGKPKYVVLGEATNLNIAIGHRGRIEIEVITHGRASHASMPELGRNAVLDMVHILNEIEKQAKNFKEHPKLGKGTITTTHISCKPGSGPIIPDWCRVILDRRMVVGDTEESILAEIREAVNRAEGMYPGIKAEVSTMEADVKCYTGHRFRVKSYFPAWILEPSHPLVTLASKALEKALKRKPKLTTWKFSTDGAYTAGILNIPTIGFGPADERYAHTPEDRVPVEQLVEATRGYVALATALAEVG